VNQLPPPTGSIIVAATARIIAPGHGVDTTSPSTGISTPPPEVGDLIRLAEIVTNSISIKMLRWSTCVHLRRPPASGFGTLTSRFASSVSRAGLDTTFAAAPTATDGALAVQLSFPPLFPHSENVARVPAWLPDVLPLGEHRSTDEPDVLRIDDLGIVAAADGLHLVSISRRQLIEPQVFHALALPKQAPPLARFLATVRRGFLARFTEFDWGLRVSRLPYLPAVRCGRAILSPEMWSISPVDDAATQAAPESWVEAFGLWRRRWGCPDTVELYDDHRSLRLTLTVDAHLALLRQHLDRQSQATLTATESAVDMGWIDSHLHEVVMQFVRAVPPAPNLVTEHLPVVRTATAAHRPASPTASWLYARSSLIRNGSTRSPPMRGPAAGAARRGPGLHSPWALAGRCQRTRPLRRGVGHPHHRSDQHLGPRPHRRPRTPRLPHPDACTALHHGKDHHQTRHPARDPLLTPTDTMRGLSVTLPSSQVPRRSS
jgi:hypothetical protein